MHLTCPTCGARYEVAARLLGSDGRHVQCTACHARWFERPPAGAAPTSFGEDELIARLEIRTARPRLVAGAGQAPAGDDDDAPAGGAGQRPSGGALQSGRDFVWETRSEAEASAATADRAGHSHLRLVEPGAPEGASGPAGGATGATIAPAGVGTDTASAPASGGTGATSAPASGGTEPASAAARGGTDAAGDAPATGREVSDRPDMQASAAPAGSADAAPSGAAARRTGRRGARVGLVVALLLAATLAAAYLAADPIAAAVPAAAPVLAAYVDAVERGGDAVAAALAPLVDAARAALTGH